MSRNNLNDKVTYIERETVIEESGDVKKQITTQTIISAAEPPYVKLYMNTLLAFKNLPKTAAPVLSELLKHMTYADEEDEHGGQLLSPTFYTKQRIAKKLNIKVNTIDKTLVSLTKKGVLKRIGRSTYQVNPNMFGRGEWKDIKSIRATFDFNTGEVNADIEREETETTKFMKSLHAASEIPDEKLPENWRAEPFEVFIKNFEQELQNSSGKKEEAQV
jgi:predicted transcriptional regulator